MAWRASSPGTDPLGVSDTASAVAPSTCGELVQGTLDGTDFLITAPIDLYTRARVTLGPVEAGVICASPGDYTKAVQAAQAVLAQSSPRRGASVELVSPVPRGKGMASSSADVTAVVHATAEALGRSIPPFEVSEIAIRIEPTDGVFFGGVVVYAHLEGRLLDLLGEPPPLRFVIVDLGGTVETVGMDRERARAVSREHEHELRRAVDLVRKGFRRGRPDMIAEGATISGRLHHLVRPMEVFEQLCAATAEVGALGCNVAHSGTVIGVMFDPRAASEPLVVERTKEVVGESWVLGTHALISGGSRLLESSRRNVTDAQRPFLELFGDPVNRIPYQDAFVLEYPHLGRRARRFFAYPDGSVRLEHPDPIEGAAPLSHRARPVPDQIWEMRVAVVGRDNGAVQYRQIVPKGAAGVLRALAIESFERSFAVDGAEGVRRVRVLECRTAEVVYERATLTPGQERTTLSLDLFVQSFALVGG